MFDIRKLAIGLTADMPIKDVDGEIVKDENGNELSITFYSPGSKEHVKAKAELQQEIMKQIEKEEESKKSQPKAKAKQAAPESNAPQEESDDAFDEGAHRTAKFLARITKSLNGFDYPGGPEAMYLDTTLGHIYEDADKFVMKRGNFKPSSASGSQNTSATQPG